MRLVNKLLKTLLLKHLNRALKGLNFTLFLCIFSILTISDLEAALGDNHLHTDMKTVKRIDMENYLHTLDRSDIYERLDHLENRKLLDEGKKIVVKSIEDQEWKCEKFDLLECLYSLGKNGIYDLSSEQFFTYFPKSEYELIKDHFDFLRISKNSKFVVLEFHLNEIKEIKFSLFGKEYPRVSIAHKSRLIIQNIQIGDIDVTNYPRWITRVLPYHVKEKLFSVDDNFKIKLSQWMVPDISRKVSVQKIIFDRIKFEEDQFEGIGSSLESISVINVETLGSFEKAYILNGSVFYLPTVKALRRNQLKISDEELKTGRFSENSLK